MKTAGLVEATERLYRSLFSAAIGLGFGTALWGMVIAPFNGFNDHSALSLALGAILGSVAFGAFLYRSKLYVILRRQRTWLLLVVALSVAVLWLDGGWRSSYYLASYASIGLAAVVGGLRWSLFCGGLLAAGYVAGLGVNGYSWSDLNELNDADSVVANTGGYLIAAYFFAAPVSWLGGYVARINQVIEAPAIEMGEGVAEAKRQRCVTDSLTPREVEVVQLVAEGATNKQIAAKLTISIRTVDSHVGNAMKKTAAKNRTDLAVIAVQDGLVSDHTAIRAE